MKVGKREKVTQSPSIEIHLLSNVRGGMMVAVETVYGKNAGVVWRTLNEKGKLGLRDISKFSKLSMLEVNGAIGWLAKENKVKMIENGAKVFYELSGR